jgi:MtN3 and saliva related transmembrane protein
MDYIKILGLTAGTISSIAFLPQVIHVWKTRSAKDLSLNMLGLLTVSVSMWLAYGILVKDVAIIYTNSMVLAMCLILLFFKFKFKQMKNEPTNEQAHS